MLADAPLQISIPAADKARAKKFYAEKLGLHPYVESGFGIYYQCGGSKFAIIQSDSAGQAGYSLMSFLVSDLDAEMAELRARGVQFIDYDLPYLKTVNGVWEIYGDRLAWFKDSEGNTLALAQIG
ncbi:MAG: VOC family protein [Anaerolineae bacterium]|nr:VOC family protein [Anaerolineae bacterium]